MTRPPLWRIARYTGAAAAGAGIVAVLLSPLIGPAISESLWLIEPMAYVGGVLLIAGLGAVAGSYAAAARGSREEDYEQQISREWSRLTQEYFDVFGHDLGRPFRRILGKARDARTRLQESGRDADPVLLELLEEVEQQAPNFRLMVANVQVLIELENPESSTAAEATDPAQVTGNIVDRYYRVAQERGVDIAWWSEPHEFGMAYTDPAALDHMVTNLVDNAVKHADHYVEIRLTRNQTHFFVRVWDDGKGIAASYLPHVFDRGWTPEAAGRRERISSGLGLFIVRTLARRGGGEVTVESVAAPEEGHHTCFTVMLPVDARVLA